MGKCLAQCLSVTLLSYSGKQETGGCAPTASSAGPTISGSEEDLAGHQPSLELLKTGSDVWECQINWRRQEAAA